MFNVFAVMRSPDQPHTDSSAWRRSIVMTGLGVRSREREKGFKMDSFMSCPNAVRQIICRVRASFYRRLHSCSRWKAAFSVRLHSLTFPLRPKGGTSVWNGLIPFESVFVFVWLCCCVFFCWVMLLCHQSPLLPSGCHGSQKVPVCLRAQLRIFVRQYCMLNACGSLIYTTGPDFKVSSWLQSIQII